MQELNFNAQNTWVFFSKSKLIGIPLRGFYVHNHCIKLYFSLNQLAISFRAILIGSKKFVNDNEAKRPIEIEPKCLTNFCSD